MSLVAKASTDQVVAPVVLLEDDSQYFGGLKWLANAWHEEWLSESWYQKQLARSWHQKSTLSAERVTPFTDFLSTYDECDKRLALHLLFTYYRKLFDGDFDDKIERQDARQSRDDFCEFIKYLSKVYPETGKLLENFDYDDITPVPILTREGVAKVIEYYQDRDKLPLEVFQCKSFLQVFDRLLELKEKPEGTRYCFIVRCFFGGRYPLFERAVHKLAVIASKEQGKIKLFLSDSLGVSSAIYCLIMFMNRNDSPEYVELFRSIAEIAFIVIPRQKDGATCATYAIKDLIALVKDQAMETLAVYDLFSDPDLPQDKFQELQKKFPSLTLRGCYPNAKMMKSSQDVKKMSGEEKARLGKYLRSVEKLPERNYLPQHRAMRMFEIALNKHCF